MSHTEERVLPRRRVLVMEDEPEELRHIVDGLEEKATKFEFDVHVATVADFIKGLEYEHFDVAVVDLQLDDSTELFGLDLVGAIRAAHPDSVVLVYSGYGELLQNVVSAGNSGAVAFVDKNDVDPFVLVSEVEKALVREEHARDLRRRVFEVDRSVAERLTRDYGGEYILFDGDEVIAHGSSRAEVLYKFRARERQLGEARSISTPPLIRVRG